MGGRDEGLVEASPVDDECIVVVQAFGDKVFHTVINRTVRFPDATVMGEPITTFDPSSMGANHYRELAKEVIERWRLLEV